ncbi:MAG: hypothetical protein ABWY55_12100 [Microbacterium sp.]
MTAQTPEATAPQRPVVITIAVVLVYISALINVLLGVLVLLSRYRVEASQVLTVSLLGAAIILFGLLLIAVASGLARGSGFSRILVTVYLGILIALDVVTMLTTQGWAWGAIVQAVLAVFVLIVLWAPPGARHFTRIAA